MNEPTKSLRSTGQLVQDLQRPHAAIVATIKRLELRPEVELNSVAYFGAQAVEALYRELAPRIAASKTRPSR
ncbi:MAG: hypothetical protein ACHRHE_15210 [Tepidisphaerales bacterium]